MHQATRKSPFKLFFEKPGFNIPGIIPEINESGNSAVPEIDLIETNYRVFHHILTLCQPILTMCHHILTLK